MKRLLAGLFATALLGGACGSAQAQKLTIGVTLDFSCFGFGPGSGSCPSNGGCPRGRVCLPPQGWSPEYAKPTMYGGMAAASPYQGGYCAPYGGYGYPPYGYGQGYGWMAAPATTQKISTVPPPEPATGSPK